MKIAIIGAGMAGLTCGTRLAAQGYDVTVFDKGRGPGGRMATRRAEVQAELLHFDHGAQYFTVSDQRFRSQVRDWEAAGIIAPWPTLGEKAYVGIPGMNAPIKVMAEALGVHFGKRVDRLENESGRWRLIGEEISDTFFDAAILAVPAEQIGPLAGEHAPTLTALAASTSSEPCWTLMVAFISSVACGDTVRDAGPIGWAARNSAKPERSGKECWVVQGSPEWSRTVLEHDKQEVAGLLLAAFAQHVGGDLPDVIHSDAHRWRYAQSGDAGESKFWDAEKSIGACGDWLLGPRVESAFLSGYELAQAVIANG